MNASLAVTFLIIEGTRVSMDPFDEWAKNATQHVSVQRYADRLVALGTSWDSFLSREADAVAADMVQGGIPLLAARDIVAVATAAARQSQAPMAIFWDLENMPIPTTSSGRDVSSRLKSILKPYGDLVQFRGYASIGLNLIPQQKRSDLQLSGCLLVDCPHNGRKEVADKMIIVDAMNFAMLNPGGATLCFVTGDVDYAYLLAVLQRYKQYRTIVISKGTLQSMLDVNCDMKMRWETDILQLRSATAVPAWRNTAQDLGISTTASPRDASLDDSVGEANGTNMQETFEPLTADEEWIDDVEFLRNLVRREASSGVVRKSLVGNLLRQSNPARFPHREAVKTFLAETIEKGVIRESGDGACKEVSLPTDETTGMFPAISLSRQVPVPLENIPERVITAAATRYYIIFIKWKFCPSGTTLPSNVFVQHKDSWGFLMFQTLTDAQRTVSDLPWLRNGILVDWRKVNTEELLKNETVSLVGSINSSGHVACSFCHAIRVDVTMQRLDNASGEYACPECIAWQHTPDEDKNAAADKVVDLLKMMAENDDIRIAENILRKQLHLKEEFGCRSRKWAALWIKHAVELGLVELFKSTTGAKNKQVCLVSNLAESSQPFPPDDLDTTKEEDHVVELLWNSTPGWVKRVEIIKSLKEHFPRMSHPYFRGKVLLNAAQRNRFYLARGAYGQVVGLTLQDAELGLKSLGPDKKLEQEDQETSQENGEDDDDGDNDSESSDDEEGPRRIAGIGPK